VNRDSLHLLLVDDEESFAKVLALHLSNQYGYQTTVAFSAREAIQCIGSAQQGFDVILLDYRMPEMTGLNLLQWMLEQKNETPVIMLTAAGSEEVAVEAMKLGAYDYVRKDLVDIPHLNILIKGTHERHMYRVEEALEQEKRKEMALNQEATERVRNVINAITPTVNTAFAYLAVNLEKDPVELLQRLPDKERESLNAILKGIEQNVQTLETAIRGLLSLFQLLYAHHSEIHEIENIRHWVETTLKNVGELTADNRVVSSIGTRSVGKAGGEENAEK